MNPLSKTGVRVTLKRINVLKTRYYLRNICVKNVITVCAKIIDSRKQLEKVISYHFVREPIVFDHYLSGVVSRSLLLQVMKLYPNNDNTRLT